jgi:putative transposase
MMITQSFVKPRRSGRGFTKGRAGNLNGLRLHNSATHAITSLMRKTLKYRLYPTTRQTHLLEETLEICRQIYNQTLAHRKEAWAQRHETLSLYETNAMLTQWKREHPTLRQVHSQVLQNVQERVDLAYKAFFRRVKAGENPGFPRYRGPGRYDSFTFKQSGFAVQERLLRVSKIGGLRLVLHRAIEGTIKTLTVRRTRSGKWYACFSVEATPLTLPPTKSAVGIDVGLTSFATLSTGEQIANPRFWRTEERALAKAQRRLATAEKGTPARTKLRKVVVRIHERIANRRYDFCHQTARKLVNTHGVLAFEALQIPNMMQHHYLAKSIADVAWGQFVRITTDKAACAGRQVAHVAPRYTSQDCSRCGQRVPKTLRQRLHQCPTCQLSMDRDQNAAINILRCGLASLGLAPRSPGMNAGE